MRSDFPCARFVFECFALTEPKPEGILRRLFFATLEVQVFVWRISGPVPLWELKLWADNVPRELCAQRGAVQLHEGLWFDVSANNRQ